MNIEGVQHSDAWNQFLKLTSEARLRNGIQSNPSESVMKSQSFQKVMKSVPVTETENVIGPALSNIYKPRATPQKSVTVGTMFDAYA